MNVILLVYTFLVHLFVQFYYGQLQTFLIYILFYSFFLPVKLWLTTGIIVQINVSDIKCVCDTKCVLNFLWLIVVQTVVVSNRVVTCTRWSSSLVKGASSTVLLGPQSFFTRRDTLPGLLSHYLHPWPTLVRSLCPSSRNHNICTYLGLTHTLSSLGTVPVTTERLSEARRERTVTLLRGTPNPRFYPSVVSSVGGRGLFDERNEYYRYFFSTLGTSLPLFPPTVVSS